MTRDDRYAVCFLVVLGCCLVGAFVVAVAGALDVMGVW